MMEPTLFAQTRQERNDRESNKASGEKVEELHCR
jgi:hypothetical protein